MINDTRGILTALRTMWFALAFVSIGLDTRFSDLTAGDSGRAAVAFLGGQAFNVVWTLVLAYLLFGGMLFEVPALKAFVRSFLQFCNPGILQLS